MTARVRTALVVLVVLALVGVALWLLAMPARARAEDLMAGGASGGGMTSPTGGVS